MSKLTRINMRASPPRTAERASLEFKLGLVGGAAETGIVGRRGFFDGWREQKLNSRGYVIVR